jgi:hypothetical protein
VCAQPNQPSCALALVLTCRPELSASPIRAPHPYLADGWDRLAWCSPSSRLQARTGSVSRPLEPCGKSTTTHGFRAPHSHASLPWRSRAARGYKRSRGFAVDKKRDGEGISTVRECSSPLKRAGVEPLITGPRDTPLLLDASIALAWQVVTGGSRHSSPMPRIAAYAVVLPWLVPNWSSLGPYLRVPPSAGLFWFTGALIYCSQAPLGSNDVRYGTSLRRWILSGRMRWSAITQFWFIKWGPSDRDLGVYIRSQTWEILVVGSWSYGRGGLVPFQGRSGLIVVVRVRSCSSNPIPVQWNDGSNLGRQISIRQLSYRDTPSAKIFC